MSRCAEDSRGKAKLAELTGQPEHRLWLGGFLMASVLTPLSLLRAFTTGWLTLYSLHVGLYAIANAIHLLRRRIQRRVLAVCALVYVEIAGGLGLIMMGFPKARTGRPQRASDLASRTGEVRQLHAL